MNIEKKLMVAGIVLMMVLMTASASIGCDPPEEPPLEATIYDCHYDLIAGQHHNIGYVEVWDERTSEGDHYLYVKYVIVDDPNDDEDNWYFDEIHLEVSYGWFDDYVLTKSVDEGQKTSPKVGHFEYSEEDIDEGTQVWESDPIDISDEYEDMNIPCRAIYIAAHAVVYRMEDCEVVQGETAWGNGLPFGKSWAMYFKFPCCKPAPDFPTEDVSASIALKWTSGPGYWATTFTDDLLPDNPYVTWCMETKVYISAGTHTFDLYNSMSNDPTLPKGVGSYEWDKINYIINHKGDSYNTEDVQRAIWHFCMQEYEPYTTNPLDITTGAQEYIDAADAFGEGYHPASGPDGPGIYAIILYSGDNSQMLFFELDP